VAETLQIVGLALLAVLAGGSFVAQTTVNATLRTSLQSAYWAAFASYLGGVLVMTAMLFIRREPWPSLARVTSSAWWSWTGGLFGALYVVIAILLIPRLGAAALLSLIVTGQMIASIIFDHFGLAGLPRHPADLSRVVGAALLIAGVVLVRR
jgi:transporter family-2 protein